MRVWVNRIRWPSSADRSDVRDAIQAQNRQNPAGAFGQRRPRQGPTSVFGERARPPGDASQFEDIVLRPSPTPPAAHWRHRTRATGRPDLQRLQPLDAATRQPDRVLSPGANAVQTRPACADT